ncbi:MAG: bifunctional diguanylate cyclase/phosphohydrolase [Bacillota bacterium]
MERQKLSAINKPKSYTSHAVIFSIAMLLVGAFAMVKEYVQEKNFLIMLAILLLYMLLNSKASITRQSNQQVELEQAYYRLERVAYIDPLTGIYNHRYFQELVEHKVKDKQPFTLILVDINHFRFYNDYFGLEAGDRLIQDLAIVANELAPPQSIVSRYGADQIALMFTEENEGQNLTVARQIAEKISTRSYQGEKSLPGGKITVSTGIACYPGDDQTREDLIRTLEQALHESKDTFGNIKVYFSALKELRRSLDRSESELYTSMRTLLGVIHAKDQYTLGHTERVAALSCALAERLGLSKEEIKNIRYGAYLHDVGKIEVDYFILNKKGPLTESEWLRIKDHPLVGAEIIRPIASLIEVIPVILHHHERYDGKGYPGGLSGKEIPLFARIVAIADSYDAMTTRRHYKAQVSRARAIMELRAGAGAQFDPQLVEVFLQIDPGGETAAI